MATLYFHIGTTKTATSSIQKFCKLNRKLLRRYGYAFPIMPFSYPRIKNERNAHFLLSGPAGKTVKPKQEQMFQERLETGLSIVHGSLSKYDKVILTDEDCWRAVNYARVNPLQLLLEDARTHNYEIQVIVYLRRQDSYLISQWNQRVKAACSGKTFEEYLEKITNSFPLLADYAGTLDKIADMIGKDHITVRRFESSAWVDGSIYLDFMDAIGMDITAPFQYPERPVNIALKGNFLEMKRSLNQNTELSPSEFDHYASLIQRLSHQSDAEKPWMLSAGETRTFLEKYEDSNRRVVREYIGDNAPLFSSDIETVPKWQPVNEHITEDLLTFITAVTADLYRKNERLEQENQKLCNDLNRLKDKLRHPFRTLWNKLFHKKKMPPK